MSNPFEFVREIREMNESICERLDLLVILVNDLTAVIKKEGVDFYGDGR